MIAAAALFSCAHTGKDGELHNVSPAKKEIRATVHKMELDGCTWMLTIDESEKKLEPENLPAEYMKEGLKVWIEYGPPDHGASICMAGEKVRIIHIRNRE